jgi:hypothetical protein
MAYKTRDEAVERDALNLALFIVENEGASQVAAASVRLSELALLLGVTGEGFIARARNILDVA